MKTKLYLIPLQPYRTKFPHWTKRQTERMIGEFALRSILEELFQIPWEQPQICRAGKPFLKNITAEFNISHTKDFLLLAIGDAPLGVDIEAIKPNRPIEKIAEKYFSKAEIQAVKEKGTSAFYKFWTKKESYGKFTGKGLHEQQTDTSDVCFFTKEYQGNMISVCSLPGHLPEEFLSFSRIPSEAQIQFLLQKTDTI